MKLRSAIWLTLAFMHLGLGALAMLLHSDRLAAIIAGSLYWPLWAFNELGLPVFYRKGFYLPELTVLGWVVIVLFWLAVYWGVANVLAIFATKRRWWRAI